MWDKIQKLIGGSAGVLIKDVGGVLDKFIRTKDEKAEAKILIMQIVHKQEMEMQKFTLKAEQEFNNRIKDLEGTASDLKQFGWVGKTVVFLRGLQRPIWGFGTLYMDYMIFSSVWTIAEDDPQLKSAFWIINFLILTFLFGERAVKNVGPLVIQMLNLGGKK